VGAAEKLEELADLKRVCQMTACSRTRVYGMMKAGTFPAPLRLGGRSLWVVSEVQAWIRRTIEQCPRVGNGMGTASPNR
jgi:prophage regulatory protein